MVHVRFIVTIIRLLKSEMEEGETLDQSFLQFLVMFIANIDYMSMYQFFATYDLHVFIIIIQREKTYDIPPIPRLLTKTNCLDQFPFCFSVIVLAVRGDTLRALMIHAYDMGLIKENYMFICVYYYSQKNTFGDISWKQVLKNTLINRLLKVKNQ